MKHTVHLSRDRLIIIWQQKAKYSKTEHVQNCVQWPFVLNYSSKFGTVRLKVMRRSACGGLYVTGAVRMDGWMERLDCLHCHSLFLFKWCRSFLSPSVSSLKLLKGAFHWKQLRSTQCLLRRRTAGCHEDTIGSRSWALMCFQCGRTLTSSEH